MGEKREVCVWEGALPGRGEETSLKTSNRSGVWSWGFVTLTKAAWRPVTVVLLSVGFFLKHM